MKLKLLDKNSSISDICEQYSIRNMEFLHSKDRKEKIELETEMQRLLNLLEPKL